MDYYSDVTSVCERCNGAAYCDEVLEIKVDGKSISDVLQITFDEVMIFIQPHSLAKWEKITKLTLELIQKTGLSHLSCGRLLKTLSGGELQRLKLVLGLTTMTMNNTLILLDEPTGGLHPRDIENLLVLFNELITDGNTLICVTHEPLLMASSSKIIELGPGGGTRGGRVV